MFKEDSVQIPTQRSRTPSFRPDAHQSATSVWTTWQYLLDAHQCLETSNYSGLHPSGLNGKSSGRYLEFEKNPLFNCIHLDNVAIPSERHSVFDK